MPVAVFRKRCAIIVTLRKTAWGQVFRNRLMAAGKPPKLI